MTKIKKSVAVISFIIPFIFLARETFATEASLSCSPSTGTYCRDETFTVDYILNTRNFPVFGADISAGFTASVLQAVDTQSTPVTSVTNWTNPSTNTVDNTLGSIIMNYGNAQPSYTGNTTIGRLSFRAIATGQGQFYYNFQQQYDDTTPGVSKIYGKKDGVNITNILTDVINCIYIVDDCVPTTAPNPTSVPVVTTTPIPTVTILPNTGTVENVFIALAVAFLFIAIGTILPAFVKNR